METGTTPEDAGDFVGTDPNDTVEVRVGKARFEIGPMPAFIWEKLSARNSVAMQTARRLAMRRLREEGQDPEEKAYPLDPESKLTILDVSAVSDPEYQGELSRIQLETAKWSVRSHKNFANRKGEQFPCLMVMATVDGAQFPTLGEELLSVLRVNPRVLQTLWFAIRALNDLGVNAKKA